MSRCFVLSTNVLAFKFTDSKVKNSFVRSFVWTLNTFLLVNFVELFARLILFLDTVDNNNILLLLFWNDLCSDIFSWPAWPRPSPRSRHCSSCCRPPLPRPPRRESLDSFFLKRKFKSNFQWDEQKIDTQIKIELLSRYFHQLSMTVDLSLS